MAVWIALIALGVSVVSAGTSVLALVETYRSRLKPELMIEWLPPKGFAVLVVGMTQARLVNHSEGTALDVTVSVSHAVDAYGGPWWHADRLGPAESDTIDVPLYPSSRGYGALGHVFTPTPPLAHPITVDDLRQPTLTVSWRQEPNTKKVRRRKFVVPRGELRSAQSSVEV